MGQINNAERLLLLKLVKAEIKKAQTSNISSSNYNWDGTRFKKSRNEYGLKTLTNLYSLEQKLGSHEQQN